MKPRAVYEQALALIDKADSEIYSNRAPEIIDCLQRELAFYEETAITKKVESLDEYDIEISDDTAERIMGYGLAASFALADKDGDMYADYSSMYRCLLRTIRRR